MDKKLKVGIVGATGMVGQRFVSLLADHPWFDVVSVSASERSAGKTYREAVEGRWAMPIAVPQAIGTLTVQEASKIEEIGGRVDFIFCAVDMPKDQTRELEEHYARTETPVVSNNSAHRWTSDVPMLIPEVNSSHLAVIDSQRRRLGTRNGFIAVKPNCSIQSYVPALHALREFTPEKIFVCTYQAISGAGKTFKDWPEMVDNVIPYIGGEEEKSEKEPLKVWGSVEAGEIGHLAAVFVSFKKKPSKERILELWKSYRGRPQELGLPSAPQPFLMYFDEDNRPQTRLDRDFEKGMGVTVGRLREDLLLDWRFVCLSHNTLRGAAGGAVLMAELLEAEGYLTAK
jgi:aspartate-semialdehyde dehydrogenase